MSEMPLYYAGQPEPGTGWGVCNRHLLEELELCRPVERLSPERPGWTQQDLPGDCFMPLQGHEFVPLAPARGRRNLGYTFFELELTERSVANARRYETVFVGSSWGEERLREKGVGHAKVLWQGVDHRVFHPQSIAAADERFVLFSGGKLELRKGQDLVLAAFRVLASRYPQMTLVTAWYNHWPQSMLGLASSPHIRFELRGGSWHEQMNHLYAINGIDPNRVLTMPVLTPEKMARVYCMTDLGLFPNRCEGGTNLVLMEYMACGRPVVASFATGHRDVVREENALLLSELREMNVADEQQQLVARWQEPSVEELIAQIERAYHDRQASSRLAGRAAQDMLEFTWSRAAATVAAA